MDMTAIAITVLVRPNLIILSLTDIDTPFSKKGIAKRLDGDAAKKQNDIISIAFLIAFYICRALRVHFSLYMRKV